MLSKLYEQMNEDVASFTYAMAGRVVDDERAVNTDDHVVLEAEDNMHGMDDVYRGLHTAVSENDQLVLFAAFEDMESFGAIAAVRSIIDESSINNWGVTRRSDTEIEFENGSRIKSITLDEDGNSIRGYRPDFFSINDTYIHLSDDFVAEVIGPMMAAHDTEIWLNTNDIGNSNLAELLFRDGAYVRVK
jgi:hypothetical protein